MNFKFLINKKANIIKLEFKAGIGRCTAALHITGKASKYKGFHGGALNNFDSRALGGTARRPMGSRCSRPGSKERCHRLHHRAFGGKQANAVCDNL